VQCANSNRITNCSSILITNTTDNNNYSMCRHLLPASNSVLFTGAE
jgi:hypothetical protein